MVKFGHLDVAFLELFELQASPVEGQSLQRGDKKRRKRKGTEKKEKETKKPKHVDHFCCLKILFSAHA